MSNIVVIGGGFAAVWSAAAAARRRHEAGLDSDSLSIVLVAPGEDMVIRPRLYEPEPEKMRVELRRVLDPIDVPHVRATVTEIEAARGEIVAVTPAGERHVERFDRLIVATGSQLVRRDDIPGAMLFHDVDTLPAAMTLDTHLKELPQHRATEGRYTVVVVGAGFVGLEIATELVGRLRAIAAPEGTDDDVRVVLVEREPVVGPELGPGPRPAIEQALDELGVQRRLGTTVASFDGEQVRLSDGEAIAACTAVWTAGMTASPLTRLLPASRDALGRLEVDEHMRVRGLDTIFAAGDTAAARVDASGHYALQACQYAHQLGKYAGHNAVSDLTGLPLVAFDPDPYVTCLDLGEAGAVYTEGFERTIRATGEAGKKIKRKINGELIYPTVDDAEAILHRADYLTESRPPRPAGGAPAEAA